MKGDEELVLNLEYPNTNEVPSPIHYMQWKPTEDRNLTMTEKTILLSIPLNLRRWDRCPREARNAYTLYYAEKVTSQGSQHREDNPHSPTTWAKIHTDWEATDDETHRYFEALAQTNKEQYKRQRKEYNKWQTTWWDWSSRLLLRKVIDRWRPHSSFDNGENRVRAEIPHACQKPMGDYGVCCLYYPVIRMDYSNEAVYKHLHRVLLNSEYTSIDMTFYDGVKLLSICANDMDENGVPLWLLFAEEDQRTNNREWCKTHLGNKSLDDLKASFGEPSFHRKEHVPIYTFGGHSYTIIVDSQSMKDGNVVFASLSSKEIVDTRPGNDSRPDGTWEQDRSKQWYLAPRLQAADVVIQLFDLDTENVRWDGFFQHRTCEEVFARYSLCPFC